MFRSLEAIFPFYVKHFRLNDFEIVSENGQETQMSMFFVYVTGLHCFYQYLKTCRVFFSPEKYFPFSPK